MSNLQKVALVIGFIVILAIGGTMFTRFLSMLRWYFMPMVEMAVMGLVGLAFLYTIYWLIFVKKW